MFRILYIAESLEMGDALFIDGMARAGNAIRILAPQDDLYFGPMKEKALDIHPLDRHKPTRRLRKAVREFKPDIVHLLSSRHLVNRVLRATRNLGPRVMVSTDSTSGRSRVSHMFRRGLAHPRVDHVICHSHSTRRHIRRLGVSYRKLTTIYRPSAPEWFTDIAPADLKPWGIGEHEFVICCAGTVLPRLGVDLLLESAHFIGSKPRVHFLVIGKVLDERIQDIARRNQSPHGMHILGERPDAMSLIAASSLFALTARSLRRIPNELIHAMAMGLPAVTTGVGGMREIVEHRMNGHVVSSHDPRDIARGINRYIRDPVALAAAGQQARDTIRAQSHPDNVIQATMDVYHGL